MSINLRKVMKAAWTIARDGAKEHGGSARLYMAEALKAAWTWARRNAEKVVALPALAWESEKAVGIDMVAQFTLDPTIGRRLALRRVRLFFPRSQIVSGAVPAWLWSAKIKEASRDLHYGYEIVGPY